MTPRSSALLLVVAYVGFVSLGLPDPLAGVAWPSVREHFALPQSGFGLVFLALGAGYCLSGFFGGTLTRRLGLGNLLWLSSGLVAAAMLGSGLAPAWGVVVACAVVWGLGSGGIDAGLNAYASNHFSARHVNWLHACYSLGATLGPLLMTAVLTQLQSWRLGYAAVGGVLLLMAGVFAVTRRRWADTPQSVATPAVPLRAALRVPLVWLHAAVFFLYVGLEFTAGQWAFTVLTDGRGVRADVAGGLVAGYYAAIGVGRVLAGVLANRVGLDRLVRVSLVVVLLGVGAFAFAPVGVGCVGLIAAGLGLAPVFPCVMARTPQRLGAGVAAHAVGWQVSAGMLGAAAVPAAAGVLAEGAKLEAVGWFAAAVAVLLFLTYEVVVRAGSGRTPRPPHP